MVAFLENSVYLGTKQIEICLYVKESSILGLGFYKQVFHLFTCLFPSGSVVNNSILGLGRFPGEEDGNPFQYSCLENPMDRGAWRSTVHWVAKSQA